MQIDEYAPIKREGRMKMEPRNEMKEKIENLKRIYIKQYPHLASIKCSPTADKDFFRNACRLTAPSEVKPLDLYEVITYLDI